MKKTIFLSILSLCLYGNISSVHGQDQELNKKSFYELTVPANFYEVDNRYNLLSDTIWQVESGFLINSQWDTITIGRVKYAIVKYPDYGTPGKARRIINKMIPSNSGNSNPDASTKPGTVRHPIKSDKVTISYVKKRFILKDTLSYTFNRVKNGKLLAIPLSSLENIVKKPVYDLWQLKPAVGQLTLPFKLRPKLDTTEFQMTTDVTVGGFVGPKFRISRRNPVFLTIPATLGLTFININDNTTSKEASGSPSGIVPGVSWSVGVVTEINKFNIGIVTGQDYASSVGDDWIYQGEFWLSFAIGYSFIK